MKNHTTFVILSFSFICLAIFFYQETQNHTKLLYAEPNDIVRSEATDIDRLEEISREDIIFKARAPKTQKERPLPSEKHHPKQKTIKPHASPAATGTVVSVPRHL
ncbi:MAG: hypothetical protein ACE5KK_00275, partial [Candidatus Brocadiales bacterium]